MINIEGEVGSDVEKLLAMLNPQVDDMTLKRVQDELVRMIIVSVTPVGCRIKRS